MFNAGDARILFVLPCLTWKMKICISESVPLYQQPVKTTLTIICVCVTYYELNSEHILFVVLERYRLLK